MTMIVTQLSTRNVFLQTPQKEKSMAAYVKFEKVLHKILTEQVLYTHDLAQPYLLQLGSSPHELLAQLMEHPCLINESGQLGSGPGIQMLVILASVGQLLHKRIRDVSSFHHHLIYDKRENRICWFSLSLDIYAAVQRNIWDNRM